MEQGHRLTSAMSVKRCFLYGLYGDVEFHPVTKSIVSSLGLIS